MMVLLLTRATQLNLMIEDVALQRVLTVLFSEVLKALIVTVQVISG
jgi:hypothetical protein